MTQPAPLLIEEKLPGGLSFEMRLVEGGEFLMGGSDEEADDDEKPVHRVRVSDFYLGKYSVTQALWQAVTGKNPSHFKGDNRPVETVSWNDAQEFIKALNRVTNKAYRLPTEAEWEYAARGGKYSEGCLYSGSDKLKQVGWYDENSNNETHDVGQKLANELGLCDMSGNVWEWCEDDWHGNYKGAPEDGSAWIGADRSGVNRVLRGGSYVDYAPGPAAPRIASTAGRRTASTTSASASPAPSSQEDSRTALPVSKKGSVLRRNGAGGEGRADSAVEWRYGAGGLGRSPNFFVILSGSVRSTRTR